jgi:hypothetical protein
MEDAEDKGGGIDTVDIDHPEPATITTTYNDEDTAALGDHQSEALGYNHLSFPNKEITPIFEHVFWQVLG